VIGTLKTETEGSLKIGNITLELGDFAGHVRNAVRQLELQRVVPRIWEHDHTVWKPNPTEITNRLGWLRLPESLRGGIPEIDSLAADIKKDGFTSVILLGMGGSSLAPEMFNEIFGSGIRFSVIDTTSPETVKAASGHAAREKTLLIVSTKSGSTVETISLFNYFYDSLAAKGLTAGAYFAAITDPGSSLAATAETLKFRRVFLNDPEIGGRFSALSLFGLVPGGLCGMDIRQLLASAKSAMDACGPATPVWENPGAVLGAALGTLAKLGFDRLTFFISPRIAPLGDWLEQLIAESTGKEGRGILPVIGETPGGRYGNDRVFVFLELEGEELPEEIRSEVSGRGLPGISIKVQGPYGIGEQIYVWEMATAVAGSILEINPFDQPNVESTKKAARGILAEMEAGSLPVSAQSSPEGVSVYCSPGSPGEDPSAALQNFLAKISEGNYISLQAYLTPSGKTRSLLGLISESLRQKTGAPVTCGFGPRYLHSTGQLHKGDSGKGFFIQFASGPDKEVKDVPVPGIKLGFGALTTAAALGDRKALIDAGRKVLTFYLPEQDKGLDYIFYSLKNQI
jgi:glucose-6-phosphate isomerase